MKIYIYELDFYNSRVITEYSCEAVAKSKVYMRDNGKSFPAIYRTRICKTPMPQLIDKNSLVSLEPLTEEQAKKIFADRRKEEVEAQKRIIATLEERIERINNAEFICERGQ